MRTMFVLTQVSNHNNGSVVLGVFDNGMMAQIAWESFVTDRNLESDANLPTDVRWCLHSGPGPFISTGAYHDDFDGAIARIDEVPVNETLPA